MTAMAWTPGPYTAHHNSGGGVNIVVWHETARQGRQAIRIGGTCAVRNPLLLLGRAPIEEAEAIATGQLWAAAPELFEGLIAMIVATEDGPGGDSYLNVVARPRALEALAKLGWKP